MLGVVKYLTRATLKPVRQLIAELVLKPLRQLIAEPVLVIDVSPPFLYNIGNGNVYFQNLTVKGGSDG